MAEETVDHRARRDAERANTMIDAHEDRCAERWAEARKAADTTNSSVRRLHERMDKVLWAVLVGLAGIVLQLVMPFIRGVG